MICGHHKAVQIILQMVNIYICLNKEFIHFLYFLERPAHSVSQPINMPNRPSNVTAGDVDPQGAVFSPKSTDPANLGVNMCMNILEGDNSPRVKDNGIKDVTQHMQNMKIYVSKSSLLVKDSVLMGSILLAINGNRQALPLFIIIIRTVVLTISLDIKNS